MVRTILFDDNKNLRESLHAFFEENEQIQLVATYDNCTNVIADVAASKPNVVLMDIDMPVVNGIEAVKQIKAAYPDVLIVMQTVFEDEDKIIGAIEAGADGYILKSVQPNKLEEAILDVIDGGAPMTPSVAKKVLANFSAPKNKSVKFEELTNRENQILQLLTQGKSYKQIADEVGIAFNTVKNHIKSIYSKLNVNSMGEVMQKVFR
jgi:DNA-binding NarL/FixJ family response regulator